MHSRCGLRKETDEDESESLDYDLDHDEYDEHNKKNTKTDYIININRSRLSTNKTDKSATRIMGEEKSREEEACWEKENEQSKKCQKEAAKYDEDKNDV